MDLSKTLDALNGMLAPSPTLTPMTQEQFAAYATDQVNKAKDEAKDGEEEKAKKRLIALRDVVATLTKAEGLPESGAWTGDNGTSLIPEFDHGFEDTTRKTEISSTEVATPLAGNAGTQADGQSFAAAGSAQGFADATGGAGAPSGTNVPASGAGTQSDNTMFANPGDGVAKALASLKKSVGALATKPAAAAPRAAAQAAPAFKFPSDMAEPDYVKDGVQKRAGDHWGTDAEAAPTK